MCIYYLNENRRSTLLMADVERGKPYFTGRLYQMCGTYLLYQLPTISVN